MPRPGTSRRAKWVGVAYAAMVALAVGLYLLIRAHGGTLAAPTADPGPHKAATSGSIEIFPRLLLALAVITLSARFVGGAFRRWLRQPPVIGEILTGIMIGPSLLGVVWPEGYAYLLPEPIVPHLSMISKIGVVLYMFVVGAELDLRALRGSAHTMIAVSHASILVPFLLGSALALGMYEEFAGRDVSFTAFSLFLGVSMSVTAFPVLARILTDRGVQSTRLGTLALSCAAVDDVSAWSLLALVTGVVQSHMQSVSWTVLWTLAYVAAMFAFARPCLRWLLERFHVEGEPVSRTALAVVFSGLLLSAVATTLIGIHALFGAFLLGAILPRDGDLRRQVRSRLEDFVLVLLLPSFFAFTGMRTRIGLLSGGHAWMVCLAVLGVAMLGKFGGTFVASRFVGLGWRPSTALGLLMNTRGLMELIVLDVGLELGMITPTVYTMLVLMAIVTTFTTTPLLDLVLRREAFDAVEIGAATDAA
jgi:Kef-type K+ transport system membrane component KefB